MKDRVCPENFHYVEYIFCHSGYLSNFALALKKSCLPWNFHCIEHTFYIQDFWATCACPENQRVPWIHCIEYIFLSFKMFEQLALTMKIRVALKIFTVLNIFYHSGYLSNLHLPWKQSLPWNFPLYWIYFSILDFWATCSCPEKQCVPDSLYWVYIFYHSELLSNLRLPWKSELPWKVSLYWNIFYHSGFLSNLRLPWKQSLPWNFSSRGGLPPSRRLLRLCLGSFATLLWMLGSRYNVLCIINLVTIPLKRSHNFHGMGLKKFPAEKPLGFISMWNRPNK